VYTCVTAKSEHVQNDRSILHFTAKWRGWFDLSQILMQSGETWSCRMQKKLCRYLLPFEHNARMWQTDIPWNSNIDTYRRNHFQRCHLIIKTNNCCETGLCECIIWRLGDGNTRTQSAPGLWFHDTRHWSDTLDVRLHVRRGVKLIDVQDASTVEYVTSIQRPSEVVAVHPTRQLPDHINGSRTEQSDWQR